MKKAVFAILACCVFCTGMSKKPKFTITVHAEGAPEDNPRMIFGESVSGQKMIFKISPEFSQLNVAAFQPFPASDGNGNGVALKLDFRGTNALEMATRDRVGQLLLTKVNGKSCDLLNIDRPVTDGIFTIWSGVSDEVIKEMTKKYPLISQSRSAGNGIEMTPSTKKEKRAAMQRVADEQKQKAKEEAAKAKAAKNGTPLPETDEGLPRGASTNQIPLEGGAPALPQPALPLR
jgi:hypothetical protein